MTVKSQIPVARAIRLLRSYRAPVEGRAGKLRLDFNENTVGCSPAVRRALAILTTERLAMYPEYRQVTARLARYFGVRSNELVLTNGIDDGLRLLVDSFVDPGDTVLLVEPTFDMYRFYAQIGGARVISAPYDPKMRFPMERLLEMLLASKRAARRPKLFLLANPNNPTGTLVQPRELRKLLEAAPRTLILVDEAYFEFSGVTMLPWIRKFPNLIVARTFSKALGLAGLRLGCLFARHELIASLQKAGSPFPVNIAALVAANAAIRDASFVRKYVREVLCSRQELARGLALLRINAFPSAANFLLADFGPRAPAILRSLARQRILLRDRSSDFGGRGFVRITVGTRAQTQRLLRALAKIW